MHSTSTQGTSNNNKLSDPYAEKDFSRIECNNGNLRYFTPIATFPPHRGVRLQALVGLILQEHDGIEIRSHSEVRVLSFEVCALPHPCPVSSTLSLVASLARSFIGPHYLVGGTELLAVVCVCCDHSVSTTHYINEM